MAVEIQVALALVLPDRPVEVVRAGARLPGDDPLLPQPDAPGEAIAGVLVAGDRTEASLGAARRKLQPGATYLWIVRALGEGGVPIGLSPTRVIRVAE